MCRWEGGCVDEREDVWMGGRMCRWEGGCVDGREDVWMKGM